MKHPAANLIIMILTAGYGSGIPTTMGQDISLANGWKFKTGDDDNWSNPELDDSEWQDITVGHSWEKQGHSDYDGFAWYRKHVTIPSTIRQHDAFRVGGVLMLDLGTIDDVDETWVNGNLVGGTGKFPPDYQNAWRFRRSYAVPESAIRWDKNNVIAVRVYDGKADGGILGRHFQLRMPKLADLIRIDWDLDNRDGLFHDPQQVTFRAKIRNDSTQTFDASFVWVIEDDEGNNLFREKQSVQLAQAAETPVRFDFQPSKPGFYKVVGTLKIGGEKMQYSKFLGFQPTKIRVPLTRESDFDQFWTKTLQSLARIQPEFQMKRFREFDSPTHEVYEVSMRSLDNVVVRGWYEKPQSDGVFPVLLRVPGYGQNMRPTGKDSPIAFFSFNVRGHGNSQDDVSGQPQNFWIRGLDDKHGYYYQGAYADCVRAVDFLASRPEVDQSRIGVTGGSQGGGLSLATAALDQRIDLCAPDIPFLCDWVKYFKASHWPEIDKWIDAKPERTWTSTLRTMSYFDTLNLADRIRCPVLMSLGIQDDVCPPATVFSVYDRLGGRKEYRAYPFAGHWVPKEHRDLRDSWILRELTQSSD